MFECAPTSILATFSGTVPEPIDADFPWLSLSILFPIFGSLLVPFIPDEGDGKQVRWYALGIALVTFLITFTSYAQQPGSSCTSEIVIGGYEITVPGLIDCYGNCFDGFVDFEM